MATHRRLQVRLSCCWRAWGCWVRLSWGWAAAAAAAAAGQVQAELLGRRLMATHRRLLGWDWGWGWGPKGPKGPKGWARRVQAELLLTTASACGRCLGCRNISIQLLHTVARIQHVLHNLLRVASSLQWQHHVLLQLRQRGCQLQGAVPALVRVRVLVAHALVRVLGHRLSQLALQAKLQLKQAGCWCLAGQLLTQPYGPGHQRAQPLQQHVRIDSHLMPCHQLQVVVHACHIHLCAAGQLHAAPLPQLLQLLHALTEAAACNRLQVERCQGGLQARVQKLHPKGRKRQLQLHHYRLITAIHLDGQPVSLANTVACHAAANGLLQLQVEVDLQVVRSLADVHRHERVVGQAQVAAQQVIVGVDLRQQLGHFLHLNLPA
ncbi:hypothetical protein COO60DRAFT_1554682 [Scenedesmus sp. NREL 46B-D3]|nr:hypothetical protein COO60DRAFT_1554682 [Scenedesmus sp. NREL 46B-D3]